MKRSILFLMIFLCSVNLFAQTTYETKTKIVSGYIIGKRGNEIASTRIDLKVSYEQLNVWGGAIKNVRVIASSQNGIDFNYSKSSVFCSISEEWSHYMGKRSNSLLNPTILKSNSWTSPNNSSIENFYIFNQSSLVF